MPALAATRQGMKRSRSTNRRMPMPPLALFAGSPCPEVVNAPGQGQVVSRRSTITNEKVNKSAIPFNHPLPHLPAGTGAMPAFSGSTLTASPGFGRSAIPPSFRGVRAVPPPSVPAPSRGGWRSFRAVPARPRGAPVPGDRPGSARHRRRGPGPRLRLPPGRATR